MKVRSNGGFRPVSLEVIPMREDGFVVLFEEPREPKPPPASRTRKGSRTAVHALEEENAPLVQELASMREAHQSIVEQQEAANEELQSANEEAQSANEELQSVNEELETSKEEIQSSNEELATVNEELQNRNHELSQLNNDMVNLFASVRAPIVMLGRDLRIRRFNPTAEKVLNLIPADVGRPIGDIKLTLGMSDLGSLLTEVVSDVTPREIEVQDKRGCWYLLRILPYKTLDNRIDGAVLMLVDVNELKLAQHYAESIVSTVREPLVILDSDLRVVSANASFYANFEVNREETEGRRLYDLGNRQWDIPALRRLLEEILRREKALKDFVVEHDFEHIGPKIMRLNARRLTRATGGSPLILLAIEDATQEVQLQRIADVVLGDAPLDELLSEAAQRVCESLDADACAVLLLDDDDATMRVRASHGVEPIEPGLAVAVGEGILGNVVATGSPIVIDDLAAEADVAAVLPEMKSMKGVPITSGDEAYGALLVGSKQHRHFTDLHLDLLRLCAHRIAQALDREARVIGRMAKQAAESESKAKDNFFAALSHELRTPMTSILGWTQLVEHSAFDPEMVPKAVEQIGSAALDAGSPDR